MNLFETTGKRIYSPATSDPMKQDTKKNAEKDRCPKCRWTDHPKLFLHPSAWASHWIFLQPWVNMNTWNISKRSRSRIKFFPIISGRDIMAQLFLQWYWEMFLKTRGMVHPNNTPYQGRRYRKGRLEKPVEFSNHGKWSDRFTYCQCFLYWMKQQLQAEAMTMFFNTLNKQDHIWAAKVFCWPGNFPANKRCIENQGATPIGIWNCRSWLIKQR